jgi:esterase/lipase superfamily enzyme
MQRQYQRWYSHSLGRDMELLVFGHAGPPIIVFPYCMCGASDRSTTGRIGDRWRLRTSPEAI